MIPELKSIAFAFKARDIELYTDSEQEDCIFINRLVCSNCNAFFHTSLVECYLCSEINYYVFTCSTCQAMTSITGNRTRRCNNCNTTTKQYRCKNPNCLSNNANFSQVLDNTPDFSGIFAKKSGWFLSCTFCTECGSSQHEYKSFRVFLYNVRTFVDTEYQNYKNINNFEAGDLIILKQHRQGNPEYDFEILGRIQPAGFGRTIDEIVRAFLA